ncbi:MAG: TetR/AcrR family transcriptional regulator [Pseudomonadota bacterium]
MQSTAMSRPQRRSNEQRSQEMRARLIAAAIESVRTVGYARTTLAEVSYRAAVSSGAIQHHFRNRNELILAVLEQIFADLHDFLDHDFSRLRAEDDPISALVEAYWRGFGTLDYLVAWEIISAEKSNPDLAPAIRAYSQRATQSAFGRWRSAFTAYEIADADLYEILVMTLSSLRGLSFLQMVEQGPVDRSRQLSLLKDSLRQQIAAASKGAGAS